MKVLGKGYSTYAFLIALVVLSSAIAIAALIISPSSKNVLEDVGNVYNITVNNTGAGAASNFTQINITLPSTFTFITGSNATSASLNNGNFFSNTTNVLTWRNSTMGVVNGSANATFQFNATASTPGVYNITVTMLNGTGTFGFLNVTVTVNDTTPPSSVEYDSVTELDGNNVSRNTIIVNATASDNGVMSFIVNLYNSSTILNSTPSSSSPAYLNFTGLADGVYYYNITANDTYGNVNTTATVRRITVDTHAPSVSLSQGTTTKNTMEITFSCSDATTTILACGLSSSSGSVDGSTVTGLDCGNTYQITATGEDIAGNNNSVTQSLATNSCGGSSSGGSGGGEVSGEVAWTNTIIEDSQEFSEKGQITKEVSPKQRIKLRIAGQAHYVGVKSLTSNSAVVEISSTPQQATMNIGDTKKFDVDEDGYYDMSVVLEDISNGKASLIVTPMHELVEVAQTASDQSVTQEESNSGSAIWIVLVIIIVIAIIYFFARKNRPRSI